MEKHIFIIRSAGKGEKFFLEAGFYCLQLFTEQQKSKSTVKTPQNLEHI